MHKDGNKEGQNVICKVQVKIVLHYKNTSRENREKRERDAYGNSL
jgi:hypothetical protein